MDRSSILGQAAALLIAVFSLSLPAGTAAWAVELQDQGLDFSDERGGFRILSVTGTGSAVDPITVTEEVTGPNDPILIIRGFSAAFGNRIASFHTAAFAMKKVVINRTGKTWRSYRVELREVETRHSDYSDGLSFGQNASIAKDFTTSSVFPGVERVYEPEDSITYSGGTVPPGGTVTLQFVVSDMSPIHQFYLLQEPAEPISQREMPMPQQASVSERSGAVNTKAAAEDIAKPAF